MRMKTGAKEEEKGKGGREGRSRKRGAQEEKRGEGGREG